MLHGNDNETVDSFDASKKYYTEFYLQYLICNLCKYSRQISYIDTYMFS